MPAPALMIALGGKASKEDSARSYAREVYSALKDEDEDGFVEAFVSAMKAAKRPKDDEEPAPESSDDHDYEE